MLSMPASCDLHVCASLARAHPGGTASSAASALGPAAGGVSGICQVSWALRPGASGNVNSRPAGGGAQPRAQQVAPPDVVAQTCGERPAGLLVGAVASAAGGALVAIGAG